MKKKIFIFTITILYIISLCNMSFATTAGGYTIADSQAMLLGGNSFTIKVQMASTGNTISDFALAGQANKFDPTTLNCMWFVNPSDIVTISNQEGGTCTITARKVGKTTLTCLIYKNNVKSSENVAAKLDCIITVTEDVTNSTFSPQRFKSIDTSFNF